MTLPKEYKIYMRDLTPILQAIRELNDVRDEKLAELSAINEKISKLTKTLKVCGVYTNDSKPE